MRSPDRDSIRPAERLKGLIAAVRRRWFATVAMRSIGAGAAAAAMPTLAAWLVYRLTAPSGTGLLLLGAAGMLLSLAGVVAVLRRIERRPDDRRVARFIEERAESHAAALPMDECVVSAVQAISASEPAGRAGMATLVVGTAMRRLEGITPAHLVPSGAIRRAAAMAGGGLLFLSATLVLSGPAIVHVAETARVQFFPLAITIEVLPGDVKVVAGEPLRIRARLHASGRDLQHAQPRLVVSSGAESRTVDMASRDGGFEFAFESVDRTFAYRVTAGSAASHAYTVTALFAPRVKRIDVKYDYPSFSGLASRTEEDGGDIYAPAGTTVRLRVHVDKPIATGALALSGAAVPLADAGENVLEGRLVLSKDDSYRIRLTDRDGLQSPADSEYFIRLMDDRPPDVRILRPSADQGITPLEEVAIEARAEDDYGISSLELVYAVAGGQERVVALASVTEGETHREGRYLLAAEDLKVRPGDVITYYAKARDVGRGKRSTETKSDIFFLEVRPFNEEFVAAQSQAGGGAGDPQLESLIAAQKEIITATWNIERRAAAGRSTEDMKAIAQAQAELKARVERIAAGSRGRRGREFLPERQAPPGTQGGRAGSDPAGAIIDAMTRAAEQLTSGKTREAIPHEMAALNGLLQAQAEVRRRQVMQQANASGGGWGNRQSQDLSALFDKELQRQQRTNYEQRSQVQERPESQQNDQEALERIRDLARRQEELNRARRDAAELAAEERKRQLEKLQREQQELQRQAEELSRQMSTQPSQQSGQQQSGQPQSGQQSGQQQAGQQSTQQSAPQGGQQSQVGTSAAMREAAEQMRRAAEDMKRDDPAAAARSGERASEQLRRMEQQMRGNSADARQRAVADLQAEAQQILQEQRRVASEAERLERNAAGAGEDARRRLAGDKDRLADRVEQLKANAERLGKEQGRGAEQQRARDAAGELETSQLGQRMRESARQLRDGGSRPSGEAEQQLARAMEQVLDKLGGSPSAEARQMGEQLDQSRQTRERLDQLEKQMRQAQSKGDGEFEKLRQQYEQELRRTRESLGREAGGTDQRGATAGSTPEQQEFSRAAPGTEAFKQDRSGWQSLRKEVDRALEARDQAASRRLAKALGEDRLSAGGSERIPEQYRRLVAKYFESIGKTRK